MERNGDSTLLYDWLTQLEVPCTPGYCRQRYRSMPFHTLFGLKKVLEEYGVDSEAVSVPDKTTALPQLPVPFAAVAAGRTVIVTSVTPESVSYIAGGRTIEIATPRFLKLWSSVAMIAYPSDKSGEPSYVIHRNIQIANRSKPYLLAASLIVLVMSLFVHGGLYRSWSAWALLAIDLAGIYMSCLLVRHQLGYRDTAAERVCGVLQSGGCNTVLSTSASKFFGLFGWSEVGLAYFSVTLATMLLLPAHVGWLALINLCCLPFTLWSIWYQRFRARAWCTMCVSIQAMLWLQFFCYLAGRWWHNGFTLSPGIIVLGAAYLAALLGINALMPLAQNSDPK